MRETGCVSVRKAAYASEPLVAAAPLKRQFVLQAVSFVHKPGAVEEVQLERHAENRRQAADPDEPARVLREMLKRKQTDPAHLDANYDPRYEARVSLGHLLGALRSGSKSNNLIPVHAFEPETQEAFDVTPTNALIMSAGPHVALRALQGGPVPGLDPDVYTDRFVTSGSSPGGTDAQAEEPLSGWVHDCTICVVSSENVPLIAKLSVKGSQWTTMDARGFCVAPGWYSDPALSSDAAVRRAEEDEVQHMMRLAEDARERRREWLVGQQQATIQFLKVNTRSLFTKEAGLESWHRTPAFGLWLASRGPEYLRRLVVPGEAAPGKPSPVVRELQSKGIPNVPCGGAVVLRRTFPLCVLLSHLAHPAGPGAQATEVSQLSHAARYAIEERTADQVRMSQEMWQLLRGLAGPHMRSEPALDAIQLQVARFDAKPWSGATPVEFHVYLRLSFRETPAGGSGNAENYLVDERTFLFPEIPGQPTSQDATATSSPSPALSGNSTPELPGPSSLPPGPDAAHLS